jgi:hypothetical protein
VHRLATTTLQAREIYFSMWALMLFFQMRFV